METGESKERMARFEKRSYGIQNRVTGDTQKRRVSHSQILCIKFFYYKTCKTEESMMGQFNGRFVYLRNSGKVAKYGIGKWSVGLIFRIED
jgi:hypothetical protein